MELLNVPIKDDRWIAATGIAMALVAAMSCGNQDESQEPIPTGAVLMMRCKAAYAAIRSYSGTTQSKTTSSTGGKTFEDDTTATIQFQRPGKIRVVWVEAGEDQESFGFVSDGTRTWSTKIEDPSKWELAESIEMAIAAHTGISRGAATTIPAILTGTIWGDPFLPLSSAKVVRETIVGVETYRAEASTKLGESIYWIDAKTYLLVKLQTKHNDSDISKELPPEIAKQMGSLPETKDFTVVETFTDVRINEPIPAERFERPKGAP